MSDQEILLQVKNLKTHFFTRRGVVKAVDGVSFSVRRGEALGIVGESGCGKSVTCLSILRLVPEPAGQIIEGEILFNGHDLLKKDEAEMRRYRGNHISLIPQDPMTSLNPVFTIGDQMTAPLKVHKKLSHSHALEQAEALLGMMHIPSPEQRLKQYPHQMSGGMRQRILGGIAISCNPQLLIADEPTTALDVISQDQFIRVLKDIQTRQHLSMIWITHDMSVVARTCDRVAVMYAGKIVETASVEDLFLHPAHPYTKGLMNSIPRLDQNHAELFTIPGHPPDLVNLPPGCRFAPRCKEMMEICLKKHPPLTPTKGEHSVSCWLMKENDG
ncbi:MAG: ABC transporter ATP-binding protein [Deltaproteobacteria bacterium]|nr:ABC transporter ATP-binding protein [Deltaproteobacteria bacterium]